MSPPPMASVDVMSLAGDGSLASKARVCVGQLRPAGQQPLSHLRSPQKDIRHLSSRSCAALFKEGTELSSAHGSSVPPRSTAKVLDSRCHQQSPPTPPCTPPARSLTSRTLLRSLMSSEDSGVKTLRSRSLGRLRPWSDSDAKPRMAERMARIATTPPATARE
ncbi:unnamed protein product, partial [Polarella glacialis]